MHEPIAIFEDDAHPRLQPLTHTRPAFELLCGAMSLRERIERATGQPAALYCRRGIAAALGLAGRRAVNRRPTGRSTLWINGRLLDAEALAALPDTPAPCAWVRDGHVVAARLDGPASATLHGALAANDFVLTSDMLAGVPQRRCGGVLIAAAWQLALANGDRITADVATFAPPRRPVDTAAGVHLIGDDLWIAPDADIDPGATLDARGGPIVIGAGVHVASHTRIEGPAAIGRGTRLLGGKVRAGTTLGPQCRIGGEVEASIVHGYANKYHDGFLGHAYVGEWVNLGALTTNSDLKNTYGTVRVWLEGGYVDSGETKVGAIIGDHVKTGIGTLLDTGTVLGVAANVFGGGMTPTKFVPSFAWGAPPDGEVYDLARCLATMAVVMKRRGHRLTAAYRRMITDLHGETAAERRFLQTEKP